MTKIGISDDQTSFQHSDAAIEPEAVGVRPEDDGLLDSYSKTIARSLIGSRRRW